MKKTNKIIFSFFSFFFIIILLFNEREGISYKNIDKNKINDFDIILSQGQTLKSNIVNFFQPSSNDFSHIGILLNLNDEIYVLHSTPDGSESNGIRLDELDTFIKLSSVRKISILRYKNLNMENLELLYLETEKYKNMELPFDYDFNNYDNKKVYCSELVWLIYYKSGIIKNDTFHLSKPIYPKYFSYLTDFLVVGSYD